MQQQQVCQERNSQRTDANQAIFSGMALIWKLPTLPRAFVKIPKGEQTALPWDLTRLPVGLKPNVCILR